MKKILLLTVLIVGFKSTGQIVLENYPTTATSAFGTSNFINFNNKMYYFGRDASYQWSLYSTDGATSGNQVVKNLGLQVANIIPQDMIYTYDVFKIVFNGKLYFNIAGQLWQSDGTTIGTSVFLNNPSSAKNFFIFNGRLYFTGYFGASGYEVCSTDGTVAGTTLLKDINPGSNSSVPYDPSFTILNNKLMFKADDGIHGMELWSTDGTVAGTNMVADLNLGTYDTSSIGTFIQNGTFFDEHFKVVGTKMYFRGYQANDPTTSKNIYETDGTAAGTHRIFYLNGYGYDAYFDGQGLTVLNNTLYYFGSKNIVSPFPGGGTATQTGIFTTDGTTNGTVLVKEIPNATYFGDNGAADSETTPNSMRILNGKAYFLANLQLWATDGTTAGTTQITFNPAEYFDYQKRLVSQVFNNRLYYVQNTGPVNVKGIYSTDGTTSGIQFEAKSTNQNSNSLLASTLGMSALPTQLNTFGDSLYFSAGYDNAAPSLWRLRNPNLATNEFENKVTKIILFPNPTANNLNLKFESNLQNATAKIISITGQTVFEKQNLSGTEYNFDVSNLNSGMYIIQISDENKSYNSKFIKQ